MSEIFLLKINDLKVSLGMISSETFNFTNLFINQLQNAQDPTNNNLNFAGVRTMAQIWLVSYFVLLE